MKSALDQQDMLLAAWRTNNRVSVFLVEHLPHELWGATVPGAPRRTVRMIAGHIHNTRCMWIKTLGKEHGIAVPRAVNRHKVGPKELIPALGHRPDHAFVQASATFWGGGRSSTFAGTCSLYGLRIGADQ